MSDVSDNVELPNQPVPGTGKRDLEYYAQILEEARSIKGTSLWQDAWKQLKRNRAAMVSLVFLVLLAVLAFFTPLLPLQSPIYQDIEQRQLSAPSLSAVRLYPESIFENDEQLPELSDASKIASRKQEILVSTLWNNPGTISQWLIKMRLSIFGTWSLPSLCGTDNLGRDVLSRVFWGARVSIIVGIVATFVSLLIGVSYGAISGFMGGKVDNIMMRIVDVIYSVPFIFVVIFMITIVKEDQIAEVLEKWGIDQIKVFFIMIGMIYWLTMARVVRGQVISLKNEQFVEAARAIGASPTRIIFKHLIPNVMGIVIVYLTLTIPAVMRFEAFLSFLGLGVEAPDVSWGLLVNEGIQVITPIKTYGWLVLYPGLTLALTLFALSFLGDGLRDALDPKMKNK
ncbi:MAG: ABC transporter permease [Pirellulaceae bacterium]